jgi:hypothetical protein
MSRELTPGWLIGESNEHDGDKGRGYTIKTNDKLAGDNASPLPSGDVAVVGFKLPGEIREPTIAEGTSFRQAMADQGDAEDRLSFKRR